MDGEYFAASRLVDSDGSAAGAVFAYEGDPSWVFVVIQDAERLGEYSVEVVTSSGRTVSLGDANFDASCLGWGTDMTLQVHDLDWLRLQSPGQDDLVAKIGR